MRSAYRALALLVALGVVLQAASIAFAWYSWLHDIDGGAVLTQNFEHNAGQVWHETVGLMVIPVVAFLLFVVSLFAGVPGGVRWAGIVLGVAVAQVLLAYVSFAAPLVGALHGANALVLAAVAGLAGRNAAKADGEMAIAPVPATGGAR